METAGLKIVMDADFDAVYTAVTQADNMMQAFGENIKSVFNSIPDVKSKLNLTDGGGTANLISKSKELQDQRRLEIAGTKELLLVQKTAANEAIRADAEANKITTANIKASIEAINQKKEEIKKASSEIIQAYNSEQQAQLDNVTQTKKLQASIDAINKKKQEDARAASQALVKAYNDEHQAQLDNLKTTQNLQKAIDSIVNAKKRESDLYSQLVAENQALVRTYYNAAAAIIKQGDAADISAAKLEEMRQAALKGQQELQKIEQGAGRFHRAVGNYASGFNPLNNSINQITREFPAFANSLQTGFLGISNNIAPLADAIAQVRAQNALLIAQGQPAQSLFKTIAGAVFSWQTALSLGITALTIYGPQLVEFFTSSSSASKAADAANKKYAESLEQIEKTSRSSAYQEEARIKTLTLVAQDSTVAMNQRLRAVQELQKKYPEYFGQLTQEQILNGRVTDAVRLTTAALLERAKVMAAEKKLAAAGEVVYELNERRLAQQNNLVSAVQRLDQFTRAVEGNAQLAAKESTAVKGQQLAKQVDDQKKALTEITNAQIKAMSEQSKYARDVTSSASGAGNILDLPELKKEGAGKAAKDVKTMADALEELTKENRKADNEFQTAAISFSESLKKKADNFKKYISTLMTDFNVSIEDSRIKDAIAKISNLSIAPINEGKGLKDLPLDLQKVGLTATVSAQQFDAAMKQYAISIKQAGIDKEIEALTKMLNESIEDTLEKTATLVSEGIGSLIAGKGSIGDIFKGILGLLGDQIAAFGKQLIQAGVLMKAANESINKLSKQPALAIAVGAAAIALGTALKASLTKSSNNVGRMPFASGGVVYGPTNALVGEYSGARGNPEVIAPLDKLTTILRNSGGNNREPVVIVLESKINGQDILLAAKRAEKTQNR